MNFSNYSLALMKDGEIKLSSDKPRLRPLVECVREFRGKVAGCELYDKVVGLAAARLIVFSGMISSVKAGTVSEPGKALIENAGIRLEAEKIVPIILNNERSGPCPMELKARDAKNNESFFEEVSKIFY